MYNEKCVTFGKKCEKRKMSQLGKNVCNEKITKYVT